MPYRPKPTLSDRPIIPDRPWWASIPEAAAHVNFEPRVIRALIAEGRLPGYQLPGIRGVRVNLNELDRLLTGSAQ